MSAGSALIHFYARGVFGLLSLLEDGHRRG
jgi:hypothetical protein